MRPKDLPLAQRIDADLQSFSAVIRPLPAIESQAKRKVLVEQMVDSSRRVKFIYAIRERQLDVGRMNPDSHLFDPLRAAILHQRQGRIEEAYWLVFLAIHFAKHRRDGWRLARDIYGFLGGARRWDWRKISTGPAGFRVWLANNEATLRGADGISRRFGNHRRYESLSASSSAGTAAVIESYVTWVSLKGSHQTLMEAALNNAGGNPRKAFDSVYRSMTAVQRFGRLAKFDYLTMISKLDLAPIEAGSAYLKGSTGPLKGARLLFGGSTDGGMSATELDPFVVELGDKLGLGMQVMEDSLCNWQKSPVKFISFRG